MLDLLQDLFFIVMVSVGFASSFLATLVYHRKAKADKHKPVTIIGPRPNTKNLTQPAKPQRTPTEQAAFDTGRADVVDGWINWAKFTSDPERRKQENERWGYSMSTPFYRAVSPMSESNKSKVLAEIMGQMPTAQWTLRDLQKYLTDLSIYESITQPVGTPVELIVPKSDMKARKRFVSALVTDLVTHTYDPATAPITPQYAYHDEHQIQARYIEGRSAGTEDIIDAVSAARSRTREIGQASEAIAAAGKRQAAALRALRETHQPTAARDQHEDYEAQVEAIESGTEQ